VHALTPSVSISYGFPLWVRLTHFFNILFITLLIRSGLEILSAHPKLYWNDNCLPGTEWLKFTRKQMPRDHLWTAMDEEEPFSPWIALPGHDNLGMGRHWHFFTIVGWVVTGLIYVVLLVLTPQWRRLIPTSWAIFPQAWHTALIYASFHLPPEGHPYNALQQLTYAAVVFLLAPLQILTGLAMSPALTARFPGYLRLFGGRQGARSLHFLGLCAFCLFIVVHVSLVIWHGFASEVAFMVFGVEHRPQLAAVIFLIALGGVAVLHVWATWFSQRQPRRAQHLLEIGIDPLRRALFHRLTSRQQYRPEEIAPFFRANGYPPKDETWQRLAEDGFKEFALEVGGLVETPLRLTLADLRAMPRETQITKHCCIEGWSAVAQWSGVSLREIMARCKPLPSARYMVFYTFDDKWEDPGHGYFYGTLDLLLARHPQTILADEMNGQPLPIPYGAPLRLRVETQLGFKMTKYLRAIEFVEEYRTIGEGQGGWREDVRYFYQDAGL
jgi:methionine sulfoxide reductase catalytic subunit